MKRYFVALIFLYLILPLSAKNDLTLKTVVIDAGHGGKDPGAVSKDRRTREKDLTLDITHRLAEKIRTVYPDIKVILSRPDDEFISLNDRAEIANKAGANLFMSIHINASVKTAPSGYSIHVLGQSSHKDKDLFADNMDVVQRENSVVYLEDNYTTTYKGFDPDDSRSFIFLQLMQSSNLEQSLEFAQIIADNLKDGPINENRGIWQNPFYVLWKTSMPAVLVELGFISNSEDLSKLREESNREAIAMLLLKSFSQYKEAYDKSVGAGGESVPSEAIAAPSVERITGRTKFSSDSLKTGK